MRPRAAQSTSRPPGRHGIVQFRNPKFQIRNPTSMSHNADSTAAGEPPISAGIGMTTGTLLIVANMIGVGVFTTTGYMIAALESPVAVLLAWAAGGVAALCGALAYAELGSA